MKYRKDQNNFIIEKILDDSTSADIIEANYALTDLELTWSFNNYKCWKYQYVDVDNYNTNEIKLHAIEENGEVIDVLTIDIITTPNGAEVSEAQAIDLKDSFSANKYKVVNGSLVDNTVSDKFQTQKNGKIESLKNEYMSDILWTDSAREFYQKWTERNPSNTDYDTWYEDVMTYWDEARAKRIANKSSLDSATTEANLTAIVFNPTHVKSKNELE